MSATEVPRQHVEYILRMAGLPDLADEVDRLLPDPVEYERAARFLAEHGITKDELISWRGGSP